MSSTPTTPGIRANFKQARLLVVEDNDDYWLLIQRALGEVLPEVELMRVASQFQAEALLAGWVQSEWQMPKLVLLDLYLPRPEQGWAVLAAVQRLSFPCNLLPVVLLSSSPDPLDICEAYRRGAAAYVIKPTSFPDWLTYFGQLRTYWWETVTLPVIRPGLSL